MFVCFLFFFFRFYTAEVKAVVKEDRQSEGIVEQVPVDESDAEETIIFEEGNESEEKTNTGNFNTKKYANR